MLASDGANRKPAIMTRSERRYAPSRPPRALGSRANKSCSAPAQNSTNTMRHAGNDAMAAEPGLELYASMKPAARP